MRAFLPERAVLFEEEDTRPYECDGLTAYRQLPMVVVLPETEAQVQRILRTCAALQVPVVAIFGPTDPARNGPYGTRSIVLRNPTSPTSHTRRAQPDEAMLEISVESVVEAARRLLGSTEATYG